MNVIFTVQSVSDLERAEVCEKYNDPKTKELIKIRCNSHVGSAVSHVMAVHKVFVTAPDLFVY